MANKPVYGSWQLIIEPHAQRDLKDFKKDKALREKIVKGLEELNADPLKEPGKEGDLKRIRAWRVNWSGVIYLIAYLVNFDECTISVIQIGPHEGFYERLKRYLYG